ncbi:MAG TPA: hypothetical protein VNZ53_11725 [Steroidobacteraceae bacterium]|nr:hypothetical protein [Bradyrhizobium sp.]HWX28089.1 hypothetical protein [Steroidobacteraceae bacterium]
MIIEDAMRKVAFTIFGAFLIAGSALQMAAASERHMRTGRGHHQSGRAHNNAAPPALDSYGKPAANVTQTCDIKWCYAD